DRLTPAHPCPLPSPRRGGDRAPRTHPRRVRCPGGLLRVHRRGQRHPPGRRRRHYGRDGRRRDHRGGQPHPRLAINHESVVIVLDAVKLTLLGEFPLEGFTRLNPAGDERHLFVSEGDSFRLLDLGGYSVPHGDHDHHHATRPTLTDLTYDARHPG